MYPDYDRFAYVVYPEIAIVVLAISSISSLFASRVFRLQTVATPVAVGGLIGAAAAFTAVYVFGHIGFEYSFITAIVVAVALPILHQFLRSKRVRAR
jgi:hypothetical protein